MRLVSIVGVRHYVTPNILDIGDEVELVRQPSNPYDHEAVKVLFHGKHVGHVANSIKTNMRGCCSAGNICDSIEDLILATVILKHEHGLIALLDN